jgi:hypothetical protein
MRNSLGRSAGVALLLVVLAALIYGLGRFLAGKGVSWAGDFGSVVSMFTGAFALITPIFSRLPRWLGGPPPISRLSLPQARDDLAAALSQQWKKEEQLRRVNDPWPLPVRWAVTSRAQAAMPGTPPDAGPSMADLSNHFDDIRDTFYRVRSRRLVILGEAGAGKLRSGELTAGRIRLHATAGPALAGVSRVASGTRGFARRGLVAP